MKIYRSSPSSDMWTAIDQKSVSDYEFYYVGDEHSQIYSFNGNIDKNAERKTEFGIAFESNDVIDLVARNISGMQQRIFELKETNESKDNQISRLEDLLENIERIAQDVWEHAEYAESTLNELIEYVKLASFDIQQLSDSNIRNSVYSRTLKHINDFDTPVELPELGGWYNLSWDEDLWTNQNIQSQSIEPTRDDDTGEDSTSDGQDNGVFVDVVYRDSDLSSYSESALAASGYRVGKSSELSEGERRELLSDIFEYELDSTLIETYGEVVGSPWSAKRLSYIASMIAYNVRMRKLNDPIKYAVAISDWESDLSFLKATYYDGGYWPTTEI